METKATAVCSQPCAEHSLQENRVKILEDKLSIVEENTRTVNKLSTKVSMLLTIMSFIIVLVASGAVYTFTGLSNFKDVYSEHRLQLQAEMNRLHKEDNEFMRKEIKELSTTIDVKMNELEKKVTILETTINSKK